MQLSQQRKENCAKKRMHSLIMRGTEEIQYSWLWIKKGYLKEETKGLKTASQDHALRTRWVKHYIDRIIDSPKCRMCRKMKLGNDIFTVLLQWQWYKTYRFDTHEKYYEHFVWYKTYGFDTHEKYNEYFVWYKTYGFDTHGKYYEHFM